MSKNPNHRFKHTMSTIYYCIPCSKKFSCKKTISENEKKEREENYEKTKEIPTYFLCDKKYWRCNNKKCKNCCKLNECNNIVCSYCKTTNQQCKRVLPKNQEEFNNLKDLGLTFSSRQYEYTEKGKLHEQAYFQFKERQTVASAKKNV